MFSYRPPKSGPKSRPPTDSVLPSHPPRRRPDAPRHSSLARYVPGASLQAGGYPPRHEDYARHPHNQPPIFPPTDRRNDQYRSPQVKKNITYTFGIGDPLSPHRTTTHTYSHPAQVSQPPRVRKAPLLADGYSPQDMDHANYPPKPAPAVNIPSNTAKRYTNQAALAEYSTDHNPSSTDSTTIARNSSQSLGYPPRYKKYTPPPPDQSPFFPRREDEHPTLQLMDPEYTTSPSPSDERYGTLEETVTVCIELNESEPEEPWEMPHGEAKRVMRQERTLMWECENCRKSNSEKIRRCSCGRDKEGKIAWL